MSFNLRFRLLPSKVLLSAGGKPKTTADIRSNPFYYGYKGDVRERKLHADVIRKNDAELSETQREQKAEYLRAVKTEELDFGMNYIKKPIKDFGKATAKIKQIMTVGVYRYEDAAAIKRHLKSPEDIRKEKSEKAIRNITRHDYPNSSARTLSETMNLRFFEWRLRDYSNDVTEPEHGAEVLRYLKSFEREKKQELERIQKHIRYWEDKFPRLAEDPSAFEVVKNKDGEENEEKK